MLTRCSKMLADRLVSNNVIEKEDYEIYQFGLLQLLSDTVCVVSIIIIGVLFEEVLECLLFMICFMVIRSYAGGYHASTPLRCYLLTITVTIINLSACKYLHFEWYVYMIIGIISGVGIFINTPVASKNNPLDANEGILYKKKARIALFIECCFAIVFWALGKMEFLCCVVFVLLTLCVSQAVVLIGEK